MKTDHPRRSASALALMLALGATSAHADDVDKAQIRELAAKIEAL